MIEYQWVPKYTVRRELTHPTKRWKVGQEALNNPALYKIYGMYETKKCAQRIASELNRASSKCGAKNSKQSSRISV